MADDRDRQQAVLSSNARVPDNENERLNYLRMIRILDTPQEQVFDDITLLATMVCDVPIAAISLIDQERQWHKSRVGFDIQETSRDHAFCAHAILEPNDIMIVQDALQDTRFSQNPLVLGETGVRFYAGAPLVTKSGLGLGTLCVYDTVPRELSSDQMMALSALRRSVVSELELRHTTEELQQMVTRQTSLAEIELAINQPFELQQVLDRIVELASTISPVEGYSSIILWDPKKERFFTSASTVPGQMPSLVRERIRQSGGATRWIIDHHKPLIVPITSQDPFTPNQLLSEFGLQSYMGVPLSVEGRTFGVLYSLSPVRADYSKMDLDYLQALAARAALAIDNVQQFEAVQRLSIIDELTGVFNRRHLSYLGKMEFSRARRYTTLFSVLMIDIDGFKRINDTQGHTQGDHILISVVDVLRRSIRGADYLGRFGGDEYLLILPNTPSEEGGHLAARLRKNVEDSQVYSSNDGPGVTISLGGATLKVSDTSIESLIERADQAMYVAKRAGGNQVSWAD